MNLLPQENKEKIKKERARRFFVVFGLFLAGLLAAGLILLLPSFFFLVFEGKNLKSRLEAFEKNPSLKQAQETELKAAELNRKIKLYQTSQKPAKNPSSFFEKILKVKPKGVLITNFIFEKLEKNGNSRIFLQGRALSRDGLLAFIKALEKDQDFSKIHSPVSNLLKEKDLEFSLMIEIKPFQEE